ncbi:MAG TPA: hypothetical protein VGA56_05330 [Opitutaceae bacterium]
MLEETGHVIVSSSRVELPEPGMPLEDASAHFKQVFLRQYAWDWC